MNGVINSNTIPVRPDSSIQLNVSERWMNEASISYMKVLNNRVPFIFNIGFSFGFVVLGSFMLTV